MIIMEEGTITAEETMATGMGIITSKIDTTCMGLVTEEITIKDSTMETKCMDLTEIVMNMVKIEDTEEIHMEDSNLICTKNPRFVLELGSMDIQTKCLNTPAGTIGDQNFTLLLIEGGDQDLS